jgi:tetratricopeptide (TPR) repeat protein
LRDFGERKRHAFELFENGNYEESYAVCMALLGENQEPQIEVLAATNLFNLGRLEEAELHFRDLARKMPDSSYVHGFLGKVLLEKGDEGAVAEFSAAVRLDPDNQDALRNFVKCLIEARDFRRSLPAQRRLAERSRREDDCRDLVATLIAVGEGNEALDQYQKFPSLKANDDPLFIDALITAGEFAKAGDAASAEFERSGNREFLRKYLAVLSRINVPLALSGYRDACMMGADHGIASDYINFLVSVRDYDEALRICRALPTGNKSTDIAIRLIECRLLAELGRKEQAKSAYEELIRSAIGSTGTDASLREALPLYRGFLLTYYPKNETLKTFTSVVSPGANPVCLYETGNLYEQLGDVTEARGWYYRAYRSDFLTGGLEYATFLARHKEWRECEKVMLYILSNIKRTQDIVRVAQVTTGGNMIHHTPRLLFRLIERLEERRDKLPAEGLEFLAVAYLVAGTNAIGEGNYSACKRYCLQGLDILPAYSTCIATADFVAVLGRCKERAIVDMPVMDDAGMTTVIPLREVPQARLSGLEPQEEKILEFLKLHRKVNEADLRKLLGTRRVTGIMNKLIAKSVAQGLRVIAKRGSGEQGEIYEYTGS